MTEISKEYAYALFALACEEKSEKAVMDALDEVRAIFAQEPAYPTLLASPSVPLGERIGTVERVFADRLPSCVVSFIQLLCEKRRIACFETCVEEYRRLLNIRQSLVTAKVTSAVPLNENELTMLKQNLEKTCGSTVTLDCRVEPAILGGLIVEMNGKVTDGSLRHRLREVKEVMDR